MKKITLISMFLLFSVSSFSGNYEEDTQSWSSWVFLNGVKALSVVGIYEVLFLVSPRIKNLRETKVMPLMSGLTIWAMSGSLGKKLVELGLAVVPSSSTGKAD